VEQAPRSTADSVSSTNTTQLDDIYKRVERRAQELSDAQKPSMVTQSVEVAEEYVGAYTAEVAYEEQDWEEVCVDKGHTPLVKQEDDGARGAGIAFYVLTVGLAAAVDFTMKEICKPKYEWVPRTVIKHREETHYERKTRTVRMDVDIAYCVPVAEFLETARAEILEDLRASLKM
jgi:hypothetical protein